MHTDSLLTDQSPEVVVQESLYEIVNDQYRELAPMSALASKVATLLVARMSGFVETHRLGSAVIETLFILDRARNTRRRPDVAFVSADRWPVSVPPPDEDWNVVPDLAIEVISPNNRYQEIDEKIWDYFVHGVRQVWIVVPTSRRITVYFSESEARIWRVGETLDVGEILPGFQLPLADIFPG